MINFSYPVLVMKKYLQMQYHTNTIAKLEWNLAGDTISIMEMRSMRMVTTTFIHRCIIAKGFLQAFFCYHVLSIPNVLKGSKKYRFRWYLLQYKVDRWQTKEVGPPQPTNTAASIHFIWFLFLYCQPSRGDNFTILHCCSVPSIALQNDDQTKNPSPFIVYYTISPICTVQPCRTTLTLIHAWTPLG